MSEPPVTDAELAPPRALEYERRTEVRPNASVLAVFAFGWMTPVFVIVPLIADRVFAWIDGTAPPPFRWSKVVVAIVTGAVMLAVFWIQGTWARIFLTDVAIVRQRGNLPPTIISWADVARVRRRLFGLSVVGKNKQTIAFMGLWPSEVAALCERIELQRSRAR